MAWRQALEAAWWQRGPAWPTHSMRPAAALYAALWAAHRWLYRTGLRRVQRAPVPLIVVGNLIVGGAGKTPTTIALVQALQRDGWTPGVISRGYGADVNEASAVRADSHSRDCGDEPLLIRLRTHVPVWVARRRIDAARSLCAAHPEVNVLVADDGLQHLALHRDVQVIVFDERGIGNARLLPAGPLREPFLPAPPARSIVVYNAAVASTAWPGHLARRALAGTVPLAAWWRGEPATLAQLQSLTTAPVLAAAGIAAPERFFAMLEAAGLRLHRLPLPDHASLQPRPWPTSTPTIVLTEKDAVKIAPQAADAAAIHVATLDFTLPDEALAALRVLLPQRPNR